jgi:hemerythrin-like domain-containing protein|tara:strand:+ start:87 stop:350 length:264 start_codon:yes stop_codon:yes gene_type:complete
MATIDNIKQLLAEGLIMMENIDAPTLPEHNTVKYWETAQDKLKNAGNKVHSLTPDLNDMIQFVHEYVPDQHHGKINHAWSGIGEWCA